MQERLADEVTKLKLAVLLRHPNQELALRKRSDALAQVKNNKCGISAAPVAEEVVSMLTMTVSSAVCSG